MKAKVTSRGQVSIPAEIRKQFNIEPESRVEWIVERNTIKVVPLPKDPVAAFRGRGSRRCSTVQLITDRRRERNEEDEKAIEIKATQSLSVCDSWIVATAMDLNAILVHKDPEFEQMRGAMKLKALPYKPLTRVKK